MRLTHSLLVSLGGISSPEVFRIEATNQSSNGNPKIIDPKAGKKKFEPTSFSFFQGCLARAYIVGHIPQDDGPSLPMIYAIVASGILVRSEGELKPYFPATIRELVLIPDSLKDKKDEIETHREAGLDIEQYPLGDGSYHSIRSNVSKTALDILNSVKETVYLTFIDSVEDEDFFILVDGSLPISDTLINHGNWVGIINNPKLSREEEKVSLRLGENEIGPPFELSSDKGYFWHVRMFSDIRKDPSWGLIKVENALQNGDDMESKMSSISAGILVEKYPIHPLSDEEGWLIYPLITARSFLRTQTTSEKTILRYF